MAAPSLLAATIGSEKLGLAVLQSKMKCDPEGYETELHLLYNQFNSAIDLFQQQAALSFSSISGIGADPTVAKDLGERAMFLAHVTPFYSKQLAAFPSQLAEFLRTTAQVMPPGLRYHVAQALILLINRQIVGIKETLSLFLEIQTLGDRNLRNLAFSHVIHSIRRMNQNHRNEVKNRELQRIVFSFLQQEDESKAKRALVTLCELHRRKVWVDEGTANAICLASLHPSSRIMISALSFLLDYEKIEHDEDSDASGSEDEMTQNAPQVVISRQALYKAQHKGTTSSKKKKKAKLDRAIRSMKRQQRLTSETSTSTYYSPLNHLKDAQGYAEKLFSRLQMCNERFEVKMMMLKVIARVVGLHRLILLNFYPFLQRYVQPHQRDITNLLAATAQACHDMVPPDVVEPLFKQIINQFVHDRSRPESIAVGLNVTREICTRMPLLMTEDLLQDLVLYKKSHEKAVSAAARSLVALFREVCPSLLVKKDRGRPLDPKAQPKAFGEVKVFSDIPGSELLQQCDDDGDEYNDGNDDEKVSLGGCDDEENNDAELATTEEENHQDSDDGISDENSDDEDDDVDENDDSDDAISSAGDEDCSLGDDSDIEVSQAGSVDLEEEDAKEESLKYESGKVDKKIYEAKSKKRKVSLFDGQLLNGEASLRALKRLAEARKGCSSSEGTDGFLTNEDFRTIKELKAKRDAKFALAQQGFKLPSSDQLSMKRIDPSKLEAHIRHRLSKEERLALVRAGREDRGKYQARTAVKQKKTGGLSNRQKEHKKSMPLAAKRAKVAKTREAKKKQRHGGKQFTGKKAWKK